jgi:sulfite dehydrogenase (quinone) subunit SoeC
MQPTMHSPSLAQRRELRIALGGHPARPFMRSARQCRASVDHMNPAFSVIVFTVLSGTGFGLWFWLGLRIAFGGAPEWFEGLGWMFGLMTGAVLVAVGVIASLRHLGKPARVWRAFSQWRSAWMSREGVFAMACFGLATLLFSVLWALNYGVAARVLGASLALGCVAAVYCTAMIYASLTPIPVWRHRLVVPGYLLFSVYCGGLPFGLFAIPRPFAPNMIGLAVVIAAIAMALLKRRYWRDIDRDPLPQTRGDAVGLPGRDVSVFERPHTEHNYLTREMGFVFARKHAKTLRIAAMILFALIPALCALPVWWSPHAHAMPLLMLASVSALIGAIVERWLFFAQARHLVTLYY